MESYDRLKVYDRRVPPPVNAGDGVIHRYPEGNGFYVSSHLRETPIIIAISDDHVLGLTLGKSAEQTPEVKPYFYYVLPAELKTFHTSSFWLMREVPPSRNCFTLCGRSNHPRLPYLSAFGFEGVTLHTIGANRLPVSCSLCASVKSQHRFIAYLPTLPFQAFLSDANLKTWNFPR